MARRLDTNCKEVLSVCRVDRCEFASQSVVRISDRFDTDRMKVLFSVCCVDLCASQSVVFRRNDRVA